MRLIRDIYAEGATSKRPVVSFEFFTPKTDEGEATFFTRVLPALAKLEPDYCSVTYGAGGSTREKTLGMVERIQRDFGFPTMAHLTCVGAAQEDLRNVLAEAKARGICNILALRGDPPKGAAGFTQTEGGLRYAYELVHLTRQTDGFSIGVAGFPEGHIECKEGRLVDWERLKAKIDCGADFVITQLFFDNRFFFELRDHLTQRLGVKVPIVPGVIPITSAGQIKKFSALSGATMPQPLLARLDALGDNDEAVTEFGIAHASDQCAELLRQGAPGIHFYTLNRSHAPTEIMRNLGLS